jgi:hypothetical protein
MNPLNVTAAQIQAYLVSKLPKGWFSSVATGTGVIGAILAGYAWSFEYVMGIAQFVALQIYLQTTSGGFLDLWAYDFLGTFVLRKEGEADISFRNRVSAYIFAPTVTKAAIVGLLTRLGFTSPVVREAFSPNDTAAFSGTFYFGGGGNARFGSQDYPGQIFIEASLPLVAASGSIPTFNDVYFNSDPAYMTSPPSSNLTLTNLYDAVNFIRAAGIKAWVKQL